MVFMFVFLLAAAAYLQYTYDNHYNYLEKHQTFLTMPSGKTLKILSFGYQNLMSDMLFIWSIQFYSNYTLSNSYDYLEHVFNTITDITPRYKEPYIVGSWIMALEKGDIKMAMRLLSKASRNIPDEWLFDSENGYYAKKYLKDYKLAEKYFARAAANPEAPAFIKREKAHMVYMEDDLKDSYAMWTDILKKAKDSVERTSATNHLHQIKYEIDKKTLDTLITKFKQKYNRYPRTLQELVNARLAKEIPTDYDGNEYIYDAKTGKVTAQKVFRWKKSY